MLGPDQQHYRLAERSVRALAAERGVTRLIVDPGLVAAPVSAVAAPFMATAVALPAVVPSLERVASLNRVAAGLRPRQVPGSSGAPR